MHVLFLYAVVVLIWGSTWGAIPFQFGIVAEEVSVAYRFALGAIALLVYAALTGKRMRIPLRHYPMVIVQGLLLFSINYFFVYYGTGYITTGLVAVTFSSIVMFNAINERLFFGTPLEARLLMATLLGVLGIAFIFWPEITTLSLQDDTVYGLLLVIIGVIIASLGNMAAVINTRRQLPVVAVNAHGMIWGTLLSIIVAVILGREFNFSYEPAYIWSLLFLAIFGSAIAFGSYLVLIRKIGSARAAYTSVLFPVVALLISTIIEDYQWSGLAIIGVVLTLGGNWLALTRTRKPLTETQQE
jgi:drug/metabolite transporter (DMT)-like permease